MSAENKEPKVKSQLVIIEKRYIVNNLDPNELNTAINDMINYSKQLKDKGIKKGETAYALAMDLQKDAENFLAKAIKILPMVLNNSK